MVILLRLVDQLVKMSDLTGGEMRYDKSRKPILFETRKVVFSALQRTAKVTIPPSFQRILELKEGDRILYIAMNNLVWVENLRRLTPEYLKNKHVTQTLKLIIKRIQLCKQISEDHVRYINGEIDHKEYWRRLRAKEEELRKLSEIFKQIYSKLPKGLLSERELHFLSMDRLDQLMAVVSMEEEKEREEEFIELSEGIKRVRESINSLRALLSKLDDGWRKGRIPQKDYKVLRERYIGKLTLAEERLMKLKELLLK